MQKIKATNQPVIPEGWLKKSDPATWQLRFENWMLYIKQENDKIRNRK